MLVETHSWKTYPQRVDATARSIRAMMGEVARNGSKWRQYALAADAAATKLGGQPVVLDYTTGPTFRPIEFLGYAYSRTPSEVSGGIMTRYDENIPAVWKLPLFDDIQPKLTRTAPAGGYLIPPTYAAQLGPKLARHGIEFITLRSPRTIAISEFRAESASFAKTPFESHQTLTVSGTWAAANAEIAAGSLFVPIAQAKARLVMALLEPEAPDSYLAWGLFNNHFERKEYMEDYVAEAVARAMLKDPAVKAEFERRIAEDKAFAESPQQRLDFFARRHASWDTRYRLYPIRRTETIIGP